MAFHYDSKTRRHLDIPRFKYRFLDRPQIVTSVPYGKDCGSCVQYIADLLADLVKQSGCCHIARPKERPGYSML